MHLEWTDFVFNYLYMATVLCKDIGPFSCSIRPVVADFQTTCVIYHTSAFSPYFLHLLDSHPSTETISN